MKALSLTQPWATLVALGEKRWETRSWRTNYRGPLAIHAAKGYPTWARNLCTTEFFYDSLQKAPYHTDDARGMMLCLTSVEDCIEAEWAKGVLNKKELAFGNYAPKRWAWKLGPVTRVFAIGEHATRGWQGLWDWRSVANENVQARAND